MMLSVNRAISWYFLKFLLLPDDSRVARAMYPQYMTSFSRQQKDSEEEVEEIVRNILQLQGKVAMLLQIMVEINLIH